MTVLKYLETNWTPELGCSCYARRGGSTILREFSIPRSNRYDVWGHTYYPEQKTTGPAVMTRGDLRGSAASTDSIYEFNRKLDMPIREYLASFEVIS